MDASSKELVYRLPSRNALRPTVFPVLLGVAGFAGGIAETEGERGIDTEGDRSDRGRQREKARV